MVNCVRLFTGMKELGEHLIFPKSSLRLGLLAGSRKLSRKTDNIVRVRGRGGGGVVKHQWLNISFRRNNSFLNGSCYKNHRLLHTQSTGKFEFCNMKEIQILLKIGMERCDTFSYGYAAQCTVK